MRVRHRGNSPLYLFAFFCRSAHLFPFFLVFIYLFLLRSSDNRHLHESTHHHWKDNKKKENLSDSWQPSTLKHKEKKGSFTLI